MVRIAASALCLLLEFAILASTRAAEPALDKPPIGHQVADLRFKDVRHLERSLRELGDHQAYVFAFTTTKCPLVKKSMPKLVSLYEEFKSRDVQFVAVNVGADDTIREMAAQAIEFDAPFHFVKDYDLSCSRALGVTRTPEFVVLDANHRLRYRGRIDDQLRLGGTRPTASRLDLQTALDELLAGQTISVTETPVDGCLLTLTNERPKSSQLTFYRHVAPIVYQRCATCHRPDAAAPFSLLTFEDVVAQANMIAEVVRDETMPPWYANPHHGTFQNDRSLKPNEKETILNWIASERAAGDPADAPDPPAPPESSWRIGEPDLILTTLEEHSIPAEGFLPYRYTVLPHLFLNETWVEAFEIRPLNAAVVHHCNMVYASSGGASQETFITGYVPGGQPVDLARFEPGLAYRIPGRAVLALQIHYTTTGKVEKSKIQVGMRFARKPVQKQLRHFLLDPRGWKIAPHDPAFVLRDDIVLERNINLLGMFTHMHNRGRDMTYYAIRPDESREILLQIPNYNFQWQLGYEVKAGTKILPKGTRVEAIAHYDNSSFNPYNPDPTASIGYGLQTVDEMFNAFVFYVDNDEQLNIEVDPKSGRRLNN